MTLFELINAIDSDNMIITINGDSAIIANKVGRNNILVEKWRIGDMILNIPKDILHSEVTNYAIKIMVGEVPEVEVCLNGIEPCKEDEEYEQQNGIKICSGRCPWDSSTTLKSVLYLFGDQSTRVCIIKSGIGRIYTGSIGGFLSSIDDIYDPRVLNSSVDNVYNETDIDDNGGRKTAFFIRIGGSK